jgi:hypothetical protein
MPKPGPFKSKIHKSTKRPVLAKIQGKSHKINELMNLLKVQIIERIPDSSIVANDQLQGTTTIGRWESNAKVLTGKGG